MSNDSYRSVEKRYISLEPSRWFDFTDIRIELFYEKGSGYTGGYSRGFYVAVHPERRKGLVYRYSPSDGKTYRLLSVNRYSKKAEKEALDVLSRTESGMIQEILDKFGLTIAKEENKNDNE